MHLKLIAGEHGQRSFVAGYAARLFLDGVEVSQYVADVRVRAAAEGGITADVKFFLTGLEVEVPAVIRPLIDEAEESGALGETPVRLNLRHEKLVRDVANRVGGELVKAWNRAVAQ